MGLPEAEHGAPRIERSVVEGLRDIGDHAFALELLQTFSQNATLTLAELMRTDGDAAARLAHRLKGASLNVGAARVAALCRSLEEAARRGTSGARQALIAELRQEFPITLEALRAAVSSP